jgi:L-ascorbate metabolism protein UlaG (beta-lactamase superfamily)
MRVEWFGQSAFRLDGAEKTVVIDPFGDMSSLTSDRGIQWDYPAIEAIEADLLLVTHEHVDHNAVEVLAGEPPLLRSTAGTLDSPIGEVIAVASEHDEHAGVERGPNTIFVFTLEGLRVAHMGDFGQTALRDEQAEAIGEIDLLFVPVGGGFTIGAQTAQAVVSRLAPRLVVPMHYRTPRIGFLETADGFLDAYEDVRHLDSPAFDTAEVPAGAAPTIVVPAAP